MKILRICIGKQRGDLELQENNYTKSENGKRCYSCPENLGHYMEEYCSNSTINGIRYFGENRTAIEKIWWAISITLSLCCGVWFIVRSYDKWENSPVIVSFATKETPIWQLPFPAVTICPYSKIAISVYNYTDYLGRKENNVTLTPEERTKVDYMDILCRVKYTSTSQSLQFTDEKMLDLFNEARSTFYDNAFDCKFQRKRYKNCSDLFIPVFTDHGICYTFNLMDRSQLLSDRVVHYKNFLKTNVSSDWSIENGFNKSSSTSTYPRRAYNPGVPSALAIKMKVHTDDIDYRCGGSLRGFKVHIGHPHIIPRKSRQHFVVPLGKVVKAAISPEITTTSEEVKRYHPERRNCYLSTERPLKYFKIYTQSNCNIECKSNVTIHKCGCAYYYMPREKGTPICGPASHICLSQSRKEYLHDETLQKINSVREKKSRDDKHTAETECGCLPDCTSMDYDIESTQISWDWRNEYKYKKTSNVNISDESLQMAMLQVFFEDEQYVTSERNELYSSAEFVANVGGLLGLFIGFTAVSFVEIIYYLTLRVLCNIYMFGKGNWSGKID